MKRLIMIVLMSALFLPACATNNQSKEPEATTMSTPTEETIKGDEATVSQTCWSARGCSGKVLNHKDRHNCKNSGGKSWSDYTGTCYNL